MSEYRARIWQEFQTSTGLLTVMMLIIWISMQGIVPFISPTLLALTGVSLAWAYSAMHDYSEENSRYRLVKAIVLVAIFASCAGTCIGNMSLTLSEIKGPCKQLRRDILRKPDSAKSDAYEALHCPVFFF